MLKKVSLKGQEYKIFQKFWDCAHFVVFMYINTVHKYHKMCTISKIFGKPYIPDPLEYSAKSSILETNKSTLNRFTYLQCWMRSSKAASW